VQVLCVRLAYYGQVTLAEAQARDTPNRYLRYLNWAIAEFSIVLTDLPEVIGIGIALNIFFGWPYYVGVLLSLGSTMIFLTTLRLGI
jgi:manganese transport protein